MQTVSGRGYYNLQKPNANDIKLQIVFGHVLPISLAISNDWEPSL